MPTKRASSLQAIKDRYRKHADDFERKIAAVEPDQWTNQSPCELWTAADVVEHIVGMHGFVLEPLGIDMTPAPSVYDDPLAAFRAARADAEAVLNDPEVANVEGDSPTGRMTRAEQIDLIISDDMVIHGWDLAKATGQDATLEPEDVQRLWDITMAIPAETMARYRDPSKFRGVEVYGAEIKVSDDASLQDRLLAMVGRDPHW